MLRLALTAPAAAAKPIAHREVLPNGIVLLVAERSAVPIVVVRAYLRAGSVFDPPGAPGLANLTAELLTRGTATKSARQLDEAIEFVGGSLETEARRVRVVRPDELATGRAVEHLDGVLVAVVLAAGAALVLGSGILASQIDFASERLRSERATESALSRLPVAYASLRMFQQKPLAFGFCLEGGRVTGGACARISRSVAARAAG